jgi:hypothetical protein
VVEAAQRRREAELAMATAEQEKQKKLEEAHDSRRMTREQRLRERETAKILKEEELRKLKENEQKLATNAARLSERHLKAMMKQHEIDLKRLNEEEDWFFDCEKCGTYGSNLVSLPHPSSFRVADWHRTIIRHKYRARSVMSGSMSSATASRRTRWITPISSSFVAHASARRRNRISPNFRL